VLAALTSTDTTSGHDRSGEVDTTAGSSAAGGNVAGAPPAAEQALALLALIAGQDVEWIDDPNAPGSRWWQIARQVAP